MAFLWSREASRAVVGDDWQFMFLGEVTEQLLAAGDERPNNAQITGVDGVIGFHRTESAVVEEAHDERFGKVVEVLTHRDDIIALASSSIVDHTALHSGAERANGVLLHAFTSPFDDGIALQEEGNADRLQIRDEWLWLILRDHGVDGDGADVKLDGCNRFKVE